MINAEKKADDSSKERAAEKDRISPEWLVLWNFSIISII